MRLAVTMNDGAFDGVTVGSVSVVTVTDWPSPTDTIALGALGMPSSPNSLT